MANLTAILPLRLLCQLVLASQKPRQGSSGIIAVNQQPLQQIQTRPTPLLDGYVLHPDIGLAYKYHEANASWPEARRRCNEEGANLAVIDSQLKLGYATPLNIGHKIIHVGLLRIYDDKQWSSVITGLPVEAIPWASREPRGDYDCGMISTSNDGIQNGICSFEANFICELPIPSN